MGGVDARRVRRPLSAASVVLTAWAIFTLAFAAPAAAQRTVYDTTRIIPHLQNECVGQRRGNCITVRSRDTRVAGNSFARIKVTCPRTYPYIVGWDARHHEHISLHVFTPDPDADFGSPPVAQPLRISALNHAGAPGFARVFAGCSKKPFRGSLFILSSHSIPSKLPPLWGGGTGQR
jgi:hypothetical protein